MVEHNIIDSGIDSGGDILLGGERRAVCSLQFAGAEKVSSTAKLGYCYLWYFATKRKKSSNISSLLPSLGMTTLNDETFGAIAKEELVEATLRCKVTDWLNYKVTIILAFYNQRSPICIPRIYFLDGFIVSCDCSNKARVL